LERIAGGVAYAVLKLSRYQQRKPMKIIQSTFLALIATALASSAGAASYDLTHLGGVRSYVHLEAGDSYSRTFVLPGFNTASEKVLWASLGFAFADHGNDGDEIVDVTYDLNIENLGDVDGNHSNPPTSYDWRYFTGVSGSLIVNALQDGMLSYSVNVTSGTTFLKEVRLRAESRVPDGGYTVALLGASLLGLVAFRRRR
jgi:hypothetical protein